jgi:hypothetical protein
LEELSFDLDTHLAGRAGECAESSLFAVGIHVLDLDLHEIHDLLFCQLGHLDFVWLLGTGSDSGGLLEKHASWRGLGDESEGLVLIDRDNHGENIAGLLLRRGIELLAEGHDVDTLLTEGRTYRRCGIGLSGGNLKLDLSCDFFGHGVMRKLSLLMENGARFESFGREEQETMSDNQGFRAFTGYAGWSAGQLEAEIGEKSWLILPPSAPLLSTVNTTEEGIARWRSIMKEVDPWYRLLAEAPDDLSLN